MTPAIASALLALLKAIDADHPKDFVDSVCAARDALPHETELAIKAIADGGLENAIDELTRRNCQLAAEREYFKVLLEEAIHWVTEKTWDDPARLHERIKHAIGENFELPH